MNILTSIILTVILHQPVVIPSCCPVMTVVTLRVVPIVLVLNPPEPPPTELPPIGDIRLVRV